VPELRFLCALWVGKLLILASRLTRRGGSTFPGRVARRICPQILSRLSHQVRWGSIVISGTNGKTTTALLLANILSASGLRLVHNRSGANLVYGVTATFIHHASWWGRVDADVAILECDEAALPAVARAVTPRVGLATNFFRDQLDRYGELERTVDLVGRGLREVRPDGFVVLNADDPFVASLAHGLERPVVFYGLDDPASATVDTHASADARRCLACDRWFQYEVFYFAHLGVYHCPHCGVRRPEPQVRLVRRTGLGTSGSDLEFRGPAGGFRAHLPVPGLYNAYNALAAVACALTMGVPPATVVTALEDSRSSFGRMEAITIGERTAFLCLIKNPAGCNEVLRTVLESGGERHLLIAINDNLADGTDVSWLWDADFEQLGQSADRLRLVLAAGIRAGDMAVRLKYAGVPVERISVEPDLAAAVRLGLARLPAGGVLYVLPTYTAMLELRRVLNDMGYGRRFWEV
jgi:UDP-N-acetylmuramyl tripeptide synthase